MAALSVVSKSKFLLSKNVVSSIRQCLTKVKHNSGVRNFHVTATVQFPAHDAEFEKAKERLNSLKEDPGNDVKLKIYGLFKQDDAQKAYIELVNQLAGAEAETAAATEDLGPGAQYDGLKITRENKIFQIQLNRPTKKNAITWDMYRNIGAALKEAGENDAYSIAVITGAGDYYCSGNDLSNFTNVTPDQMPAMAKKGKEVLLEFVNAFIDFPKPLIALVNGPAVGVSVTTLALCDAVYCADNATFHTPFSALGQSPEACSSYLFPKIMGTAKASEMLLFNRRITAGEAKDRNLVSDVFPADVFQTEAAKRMQQYASFPPQSMRLSKVLNRSPELKILKDVNKAECELLEERWQSKECVNAIMAFFTRKN